MSDSLITPWLEAHAFVDLILQLAGMDVILQDSIAKMECLYSTFSRQPAVRLGVSRRLGMVG